MVVDMAQEGDGSREKKKGTLQAGPGGKATYELVDSVESCVEQV